VPWCPSCERFLSPPTVTPDGRCPACGRPVEPGRARPPGGSAEPTAADDDPAGSAADEELPPIPLRFKVLGVALVIYLGYRFAQGVEWVIHRF
jgi:hypothetical protein